MSLALKVFINGAVEFAEKHVIQGDDGFALALALAISISRLADNTQTRDYYNVSMDSFMRTSALVHDVKSCKASIELNTQIGSNVVIESIA